MQSGADSEHGGGGATAAGKGGGAGQHRREDYAAYLRHHGVYSERNAKLLREVSDLLRQVLLVEGKLTKSKDLTG